MKKNRNFRLSINHVMTKLSFYLLIILSVNGFIVTSQTFERQILSSADDAEEKFDGSYVTTTSSDIEMMYDTWNSQGLQTLGFRFDNIVIPASSTITNAYIQFTADGSYSGNLTMTIKGEDVANSSMFTSTSNNISNRTVTTSNVQWNSIPSWSDNQSGAGQQTPDLSAVVSEIMTSNGWQSGNPITFIITGTGSDAEFRKSYSFDGNSSKVAKLVIQYTSNLDVDLALSSCISPTDNIYPNPASVVQVEIISYGNLTATNYSISYSIDGNLIATEPGITPLTLGQSVFFTFAQTVDLSTIGAYNLTVDLTINNDENLANNTITKSISVINEVNPIFFSQGSSWRYLDNGSDPGPTWSTVGYNDSSWPVGINHLGFGDGDEQTILNDGLISYYFRKKISVPDVNQLNEVYLHMVHDEGAIVFINGQEVVRTEMMPLGVINHNTIARQSINSSIENDFYMG